MRRPHHVFVRSPGSIVQPRPFISSVASELPAQLTVKTSSSKKRKLARPPPSIKQDSLGRLGSSSPDSVLPSCERDDHPLLSSSADSVVSGPDLDASATGHLRTDSLPASSLPPRLQNHASSLVSFDYASSVASSPCASAYAELSLESDRGGDETGSAGITGRSQSPFSVSRRAIMNGDAELPHRSSSPLKRRASSMDPDGVDGADGADSKNGSLETSASHGGQASNVPLNQLPRAMSVDAPPLTGQGAPLSQRKMTL